MPETLGDRPGREECDARAPIHFIGFESQFEGSSASNAVAHRPIKVAARLLDLETPQALGYIGTMVITSSAKAGINMITAIYDWHVTGRVKELPSEECDTTCYHNATTGRTILSTAHSCYRLPSNCSATST